MKQRHAGVGGVVVADHDHRLQRRRPGREATVHGQAQAHGHHQLQQRRRVGRHHARYARVLTHHTHGACAVQRLPRQALPVGVARPGDGVAGRVLLVGIEANALHGSGLVADAGHQTMRVFARKQHVGPARAAVRSVRGHGQVDAREVRHRRAAVLVVGGAAEGLGADRREQSLGKVVGLGHGPPGLWMAGSPGRASAWKSRRLRVKKTSAPALRAAARCSQS